MQARILTVQPVPVVQEPGRVGDGGGGGARGMLRQLGSEGGKRRCVIYQTNGLSGPIELQEKI